MASGWMGEGMIGFQIEDMGAFTRKLFLEKDFDDFLLKEATIVTFNRFTIDGRLHRGFYSAQEQEQMEMNPYSLWSQVRPICFSLIKGKRLPESFQITLEAPPKRLDAFLAECRLQTDAGQIKGLYLNIRYENGRLQCITGTSLAVFTLDKSVEREWDEYVGRMLKNMGIAASH